jgi:hypothetical protein
MVVCFSCGAELVQRPGSAEAHRCQDCLRSRNRPGSRPSVGPELPERSLARPILTLIKPFPTPPDRPPHAAA